ncbi:hypothetical protein BCR36DRAFT_124950 [Piromyces finnis]|uniref:Uncharacterized protein n=1 Tax=Piromyces finnis TaxID=1754191 RepID=A0A1Y1V0Z0_9FUNG|nr:hypothetical protein BCR36DRAFT_124950 [Piromyces finnis]|eukprot:ORX44678.1 hypothetical protein BCR36DRAFT_124950 [Piromyces finnis]
MGKKSKYQNLENEDDNNKTIKANYHFPQMVKMVFPEYGQTINRKKYKNIIWFQLLILIVMFSGVLIFSQGFLLTRRALENDNKCNLIKQGNLWNQKFNNITNSIQIEYNQSNVEETCWYPRRYKKAVILIIDALRFDFMNWEDDPKKIDPYYSNKLTVIHKLLTKQPNNSLQFLFKSDPPTTTMQRLKGLHTGTLPTFIDAGKNFAAESITEDNLIKKIVDNGKKIKFMGDDTWMGLFGDYLDEKSIPCDSLNVWDLYSVDNKIKENLFPSLRQKEKDWDVLVAHFLGVDHCGHRYNPSNEHMDSKLNEMNSVIENVIEEIDDDTLLVIFGDHGMSTEGDHGGESLDELNAGLFLYNKKGFFDENYNKKYFEEFLKELKPIEIETENEAFRTIPQIDYASTLALLLGLPIPFQNIGTIIPELFWYPSPYGNNEKIEANILQNIMEALRINTFQIQNFVDTYYESNKKTRDLYNERYEILEKRLNMFIENHKEGKFDDDIEELKSIILEYISYNRQTLHSFRQVWATFNVPLFTFGFIILILAIICEIIYISSEHNVVEFNLTHHFWFPVGCGSIFTLLIDYGIFDKVVKSLFNVVITFEPYQMILGGFSFGACVGYIISYIIKSNGRKSIINHLKSVIYDNTFELFPLILIFGHGFLMNSDSYIIYEDSITQYVLQSFGIYLIYRAFLQQLPQVRNKMITYSVIFMVLIRISSYYDLCRVEKTGKCKTTFKTSIPNYFLFFVSLAFFPYILKKIMKENFHNASKYIIKYLIPCGLILAAIYWGIDTLEELNGISKNLEFLINMKFNVARYGYTIIPILSLGVWAFFPITFDSKVEPSKNMSKNILNFYGIKNHLGSSYLLFLAIIIMSIIQVSKPISSLNIVLCFCSFMCVMEIFALEKECQELMNSAETLWNSKPREEKKILLEKSSEELLNEVSKKGGSSNPNSNAVIENADPNKYIYTFKTKNGSYMRISHKEMLDISYKNISSSFNVPLSYVTLTSFLTLHIFFRTSHQATLQSIDWSLAFIGQKELNFVKAGFNLILNILSGPIIGCFFVPLLVFWKQETTNNNEKPMVKSISKAFIKYSLAYSVSQVFSIISAGNHKRHLMLWSVFAPRYMIGGITLCFIPLLCLVATFIIIIMVRGVNKHLKKIEEVNNKLSINK